MPVVRYIHCTDRVNRVPDVRVLTRPCAESFQLALRLAHPSTEEVALAKRHRFRFGVAVHRVESLVMFYEADNIVLLRQLNELLMVLEQLDSGLRHKDVHATFNGILRNVVVSIWDQYQSRTFYKRLLELTVRSEDDHCVSWCKVINRNFV